MWFESPLKLYSFLLSTSLCRHSQYDWTRSRKKWWMSRYESAITGWVYQTVPNKIQTELLIRFRLRIYGIHFPPYTIELCHYLCSIFLLLPFKWAHATTHTKLAKRKNLHTSLPLDVYCVHIFVYLFTCSLTDGEIIQIHTETEREREKR